MPVRGGNAPGTNVEEDLTLVVVRGFGAEPMMLLTDVNIQLSRASVWFVVQGYLGRWMVEETIRFIKQSYRIEDIRVLTHDRLKNVAAQVSASAYFAAVWLGEGVRVSVLRHMVARLSKRFFGIPGSTITHWRMEQVQSSPALAAGCLPRPTSLLHSRLHSNSVCHCRPENRGIGECPRTHHP